MYATPLYVCCGWQFERLSTTAFFPILHFLQVWLLRVYASVSSHDIWVSFNSSKIPFCVHNCHSSGLFTPFLVQYDWHESENESVQMFFFISSQMSLKCISWHTYAHYHLMKSVVHMMQWELKWKEVIISLLLLYSVVKLWFHWHPSRCWISILRYTNWFVVINCYLLPFPVARMSHRLE